MFTRINKDTVLGLVFVIVVDGVAVLAAWAVWQWLAGGQ